MGDDCRHDDYRRLECCEQECKEKCVRDCYCNDYNNCSNSNGVLLLFLLILVYCIFCGDNKNGGLFGGLF